MNSENINDLPVAVLRGMIAFPNTEITFDAGRRETIMAINAAMKGDKTIFLSAQSNQTSDEVSIDNCMNVGVVGRITQAMQLPAGITRVIVKGETRAHAISFNDTGKYLKANVVSLPELVDDPKEYEALKRELKNEYRKYFSTNSRLTADLYARILAEENGSALADNISSNLPISLEDKQDLLETVNVNKRMEQLLIILVKETDLLSLQMKIEREVKKKIDKNQREYYLHEQMKVIEKELGDKDGRTEEMQEYRKKIESLCLSEEISDKLYKEVDRIGKTGFGSPEGGVIRTYLDTVLALPWNMETEENLNLENARKTLDEDHYGLEKVKESILLNLAVRNFNAKGTNILCLVGPPGVGKTSVVKSVAKALGRNYARISLGGVHDEADIRGHRKTYIGAMPGRIMKAVSQAKSKNALILLDEIDKVGSDYRGDPSAALLEVLDSEQNYSFHDHYIELPFDLSDIMFITTANTLETVSRPLLDRMEVIELSGYTREEKLMIAKNHLIPKALEKTGMKGKRVTIADAAITELVDYYTRESGVRNLERSIIKLLSGAAKIYIEEGKKSLKITKKYVETIMGKRIYSFDPKNKKDDIGIARGLAWTAVGGDTLSVEVNVMPGSGNIDLTGKLGDVMKESAMAAISYIRSVSDKYKLPEFHKNKDIHIHVPEGAVPKDGPSAGITMATAAFSAISGRKVRCDVAMTGEITLRGKVLPIGGLKEKSLAAHRAGINTVIIPKDNVKDLDDIPQNIKDEMEFIPVSDMEQVLKAALAD